MVGLANRAQESECLLPGPDLEGVLDGLVRARRLPLGPGSGEAILAEGVTGGGEASIQVRDLVVSLIL